MGVTNTKLFTPKQNEMAALVKAMGHPARIAILEHLLDVNACIGMEIVEKIPLAQPTISRHLKELKDAGLIQGDVEGTRIHYCINKERWQEVQDLFNEFFDKHLPKEGCD